MQMLPAVVIVVAFHTVVKGDDGLPFGFYHFSNLDEIKSFFLNEQHPYAKKIVETFEKQCIFSEQEQVFNKTRKPFIVIEGNHRASREVIAKKLARRMNARYLTNLAPCLFEMFHFLSHGSVIRRIFYLLSIYAVAAEAQQVLNTGRAVIVNGYWWEQVTYSLLQSLKENPIPPLTSHVFHLPPDLLQPDLTIFVDLPNSPDIKQTNPIKQRSAELYKALSDRYPIMTVSMDDFYRMAIDAVYTDIHRNLSDHRDFGFIPWRTFTTTTSDDLHSSSSEF